MQGCNFCRGQKHLVFGTVSFSDRLHAWDNTSSSHLPHSQELQTATAEGMAVGCCLVYLYMLTLPVHRYFSFGEITW